MCENARNAFESRFPAPPDTRPRSSLPGYFRLPGCFWLLQLVVLLLLAPALLWAAPARRFSRMLLAPGGSRLLPIASGWCPVVFAASARPIPEAEHVHNFTPAWGAAVQMRCYGVEALRARCAICSDTCAKYAVERVHARQAWLATAYVQQGDQEGHGGDAWEIGEAGDTARPPSPCWPSQKTQQKPIVGQSRM